MSNTYVLGINESHDSSAALCKNGEIVCAIAQERITRVKHQGHVIKDAIEYVLDSEGINPSDLDLVVSCIHGSSECDSVESQRIYKELLKSQVPLFVTHPSHHELHAFSACLTSPFKESAVMVCDGMGSRVRGPAHNTESLEYYEGESLYISNMTQLKKIYEKSTTHYPYQYDKEDISLGRLYSYASKHVFESRYDAGKLMALASCDSRESSGGLQSFLEITDNVKVKNDSLRVFQFEKEDSSDLFDPSDYVDLAHRVQNDTEEALLYYAKRICESTKIRNLCFAGGVALNCQANSRLLNETGFENVHIMSAPTDDGISLGAALYGYHVILGKPWSPWERFDPFLGKTYEDAIIIDSINRKRLSDDYSIKHFGDDFEKLCQFVAHKLCEGKVVGWFQDGSEFGPRALGNRSILASPSAPGIKDHINKHVKQRELFRPFSPSVLQESVSTYFDVSDDYSNPLMLFTAKVRQSQFLKIKEVIHVDDTARVQTVTKDLNAKFYSLIKSYYELSGIPMLLNTSFNGRGQPIVETPSDAINMFTKKPIDILVLGSRVIY